MPGEWLANNEYTSPATVNEIIALMGQNILRGMLEEIRANLLMKLLMFLTMSKLAYQFDGLILIMLFMKTHSALSNWKTLKPPTLFTVIKDFLIRCSLPITFCRGQAFHRQGNMSGFRNGVQALMKKESSQALFTLHSRVQQALKAMFFTSNCNALGLCRVY